MLLVVVVVVVVVDVERAAGGPASNKACIVCFFFGGSFAALSAGLAGGTKVSFDLGGKIEKEWAKFGLGISIILRRRTESMRTGVTHVRTQLPKLSEKKNTHAWLACFLPARPNEYFCEKRAGMDRIEKRASD